MLFTVFSLLELFFSYCIVVAVAKENLLETRAIVSPANFQRIQMLRHPRLAFDWLSVSFFDYWPIRMSGLLLLCTELTFLCIELPETAFILTNQNWVNLLFIRNSNERRSWSWGKIEELKSSPINFLSLPPLSPLSLPPLSPLSASLPPSLLLSLKVK